jgi:hypothetical protein
VNLAPLDLVSAHPWQRVTFTTYALSLSFFEAVILDALVRGGGRQALILADVQGVRASLSEQGAQRVGKDYGVEPVAVSSGVFHPKISVLSGTDECHLLVGSGNLTFGGWGGNCEVLEHLHPDFAADAIADAADFFELMSVTQRVRHGANEHCDATAAELRHSVQGKSRNGDVRLFYNLDRSISEQLVQVVDDLGGANQMLAAAPFWDHGTAIHNLCQAIKLDHVFIHAHASGTVEGTAGSNWPVACRSKIHPIRLEVMDAQGDRRLHAKAFEIMCKRGRVLVSGSPNGTTAALGRDQNVEACVVRIQRERMVGWKFIPSEAPEPQAALDADSDDEEQRRGVLRAVLDADEVQGKVLTPAMSGIVSVFHVSTLGPELLAQTSLSADGRFQVSTPMLEEKSWVGGRLVIRVQDAQGRQAEGFVSIASFSEITRRAGIVGRRLLALLAGTETPADVAAIMSWFHEDPKRLSDTAPDAISGRGKDPNGSEKPNPTVVVAELAPAAAAASAAAATASGHHGAKTNWSRFMDHILAAFRQKRGPFGRTSSAGKGEDDEDETDGSEPPEADVEDPAIEKTFAVFERLFDVLLKPGSAPRQIITAFDLAEYICERLRPEAAQAMSWLKRLIGALLDAGVPPERRNDVAAAVMTLLGASQSPRPRSARESLLRLNMDLSNGPPSSDSVMGFQSVLPQSRGFTELWSQVEEIRTYPELVRSYLEAIKKGGPANEFPELAQAANEEWPTLRAALTSKDPFKNIIEAKLFSDACPRCHLALPTSELSKLRSVGIATARNCCRRIIIWGGN